MSCHGSFKTLFTTGQINNNLIDNFLNFCVNITAIKGPSDPSPQLPVHDSFISFSNGLLHAI